MKFNTTSYLAGVGSVVAVLSTGFAGGYFLANPAQNDPPNRLQRVASNATLPNPAPQIAVSPKQQLAEAPTAPAPVTSSAPPAPVLQQPAQPDPVVAKAPEPVRAVAEQQDVATVKPEKLRAAETNRAAEKKRMEARAIAERQRKQKEIEIATVAVRRLLHNRDVQEVVETDDAEPRGSETPRFGLFGQ
jgi:type IV secretory pathway VirB10-like protein